MTEEEIALIREKAKEVSEYFVGAIPIEVADLLETISTLADRMEARGKQEPYAWHTFFKTTKRFAGVITSREEYERLIKDKDYQRVYEWIPVFTTHADTGEVSSLKREVAELKSELVVKTAQVERLQEAGLSVIACEREELKSRIIGMEGQLTAAIYNANLYDRERNEANALLSAMEAKFASIRQAVDAERDYDWECIERIDYILNTVSQETTNAQQEEKHG